MEEARILVTEPDDNEGIASEMDRFSSMGSIRKVVPGFKVSSGAQKSNSRYLLKHAIKNKLSNAKRHSHLASSPGVRSSLENPSPKSYYLPKTPTRSSLF